MVSLFLKKKKEKKKNISTSLCRKELVHSFTSSVRKWCLGLGNNELPMCFSNQSVSMKFTVFGDHLITKAAVYEKFIVDSIFVSHF